MPKSPAPPDRDLQSLLGPRNLILLGCGNMGQALLDGWLDSGVPSTQVQVFDPQPTERLCTCATQHGIEVNPAAGATAPAVAIVAVKPQVIDAAVPTLQALTATNELIISIAAGTRIAQLQNLLPGCHVVRCMPNTPAAIGHGITAIIGDANITAAERDLTTALLTTVGATVWLRDETEMDAVTAVFGSGPAYVFHLIEALAGAGVEEGLEPELALSLARATVAGAGALAIESGKPPVTLRTEVTSPGGTTAAGLGELMEPLRGLQPLINRTVAAAAHRSRELAES